MMDVRALIPRSSGAIALADQIVVSGCSFLTMLIAGRFLPIEEFGLFSLAIMSFLFLANLHRAVFTQPMNIFGAVESSEKQLGRLKIILHLHIIALPAAALILALLSALFFPDGALLFALIFAFSGFALQETLRRYWYMRGETGEALANDLISYGGQVVLLLLLIGLNRLNGITAFLAMGITSLVAFLYGRFRRLEVPALLAAVRMQAMFRQQWDMTKWLILTVLAIWGAGQVYPFLMLPLGPAVVASFSACRTLLNAMGLIVQTVGNYLPPKLIILLRDHGKEAFRKHLLTTCAQALVLGGAFLLTLHFLAEPLLHFLYGGRYDHAAPIMRILAIGTVCSLIGAIFGAYALALEDSRSGFLANLGASVVTFTIGLWLINQFSVRGAAIATTLSLATAMTLQVFLVLRRYRHLPSGDAHA